MSCLLSSSSAAATAMVPPNCCWADRLLLAAHAYLRDSCFTTLNAAGGTGAVALDNKIEQAMDLVKSHLMFAVREEVDVLKEKITELTDRITQLEYENGVLRAHASPEVLSQLSGTSTAPNPTVPQSPGNPPSS